MSRIAPLESETPPKPPAAPGIRSGPDPTQIGRVIQLLVEARDCATALGKDIWEFAIEVRALRELGPTNTVLRWLLDMGYAAHAAESAHPAEGRRTFDPIRNLSIPDDACFVLTPAGVEFARLGGTVQPLINQIPQVTPIWDSFRRELRVQEVVVKRYRQPAEVQELVLQSFEEEGWPGRIDDPLPPLPDIDAKRRLHTTIMNLNRFQKRRLIRFEGGGDGQSVGWRLLTDSEAVRLGS